MRAWISLAATLAIAAALGGCAHPITMATDNVSAAARVEQKIDGNIGFVIPDALRNTEITTPGGGGDKVRYYPYRDLELPLYATLSSVFANATKLSSATDTNAIRNSRLSYILTPQITTDSRSDSAFTWPPTDFTVSLVCTVTDINGAVVLKKTVTGQGHAEFSEFKRNFSLSAQRASEDMLKKLQALLATAPELRGGAVLPVPATAGVPAATVTAAPTPAVTRPAAVATALAQPGAAAVAQAPARPVATATPARGAGDTPVVSLDDLRYLVPAR